MENLEDGFTVLSTLQNKSAGNFSVIKKGATMITYEPLWRTMEKKKITKSRLVGKFGLSPSLITKLKRNESITVHTLDKLCEILDCNVEDVIVYKKE